MSAKFNGFSQEDINKLTSKSKRSQIVSGRGGIRRLPEKKIEDTMKQITPKSQNIIDDKLPTTDDSMTSLQEAVHFRPLSSKIHIQQESSPEILRASFTTDESILHLEKENRANMEEFEKHLSPFKGISLKDFENQRKLIEEQNKQKKELLYKAIEHHSQKTAAEAKKIQDIKAELSKLDSELALDVAILRKEIELAAIQYSNVQKQYQRVESQFLKAKMDLYQASEKKELLTEHLCTLISHNEDRKAKKLSELMKKVGISETGDLGLSQE